MANRLTKYVVERCLERTDSNGHDARPPYWP